MTPINASIVEAGDLESNGIPIVRGMLIQFDNVEDLRDALKHGVPIKAQWPVDRTDDQGKDQ